MLSRRDILNGAYDDQLEDILDALKRRKEILATQSFWELKVGDKIRFVNSIRPTYLAGLEATVTEKRTKKLGVKLDHPVGRFYGTITVPPSLVEKITTIHDDNPEVPSGGPD